MCNASPIAVRAAKISLLTLTSLLAPYSFGQISFQLVPLPTGSTGVYSQSLSRDGLAVVGQFYENSERRPFLWTPSAGFSQVPSFDQTNDPYGCSYAASLTGSTVVGLDQTTKNVYHAFVFTKSKSTYLGSFSSDGVSGAQAVSADGTVVAGVSDTPQGVYAAFRWTNSTGLTEMAPAGSGYYSNALGISGNGSVIIGWSGTQYSTGKACFWIPNGSIHALAVHGTDAYSRAQSANLDGSYIGGTTGPSYTNTGACIWHAGTVNYLGDPPGESTAIVNSVTDSGNAASITGGSDFGYLWTPQSGVIKLQDYLASRGVNIQGATYILHFAMSADGTKLSGGCYVNSVERAFYITNFIMPSAPASITFAPSTIGLPGTSTATVHMTNAATANTVLNLTSLSPSIASVPATVTVLKGATQATFPVTAHSAGTAKIYAVLRGTETSNTITVN